MFLSIVRKDGVTEYKTVSMTPTVSGRLCLLLQTLFHISSCSKAFLSSTGILIDDSVTGKNTTVLPEGVTRLTWETEIKDILPAELDWSLVYTWAYEKVNVRDILSHVLEFRGTYSKTHTLQKAFILLSTLSDFSVGLE